MRAFRVTTDLVGVMVHRSMRVVFVVPRMQSLKEFTVLAGMLAASSMDGYDNRSSWNSRTVFK